jgi:hypothetical protein
MMSHVTSTVRLAAMLSMLTASAAHSQATIPLRTIASQPSCATCSIELDVVATLALPTDSLSFGIETRLTRLSNGTFVVWGLTETKSPVLFDASGRFSRVLAREGQGPGELGYVDLAVAGPADTLWVISRGRKHVFTSGGRFVRAENVTQFEDVLWFAGGGAVIAALEGSSQATGYPLHVLDRAGSITRSFGVNRAELGPARLAATGDDSSSYLQRALTRGANETFWASSPRRFLLEQYDQTGRLINQGRHAVDGWYKDLSERRSAPRTFTASPPDIVQESSAPELLWLVYHDRNAKFVSAGFFSKPMGEIAKMHDVVIEAVDARTLKVLAMRRFPGTNAWTAPIDDVFHALRVTRLRLVRSR